MAARIIGVGQAMAGDDGVGIAVARRIRQMRPPAAIEVVEVAEPSALLPLLTDSASLVVLIDALVDGGTPGRILRLGSGAGARRGHLLSSHGVGVLEAIELARSLDPENLAQRIEIIGVTIARPARYGEELSPGVARAVERAAAEAIKLARA